MSDGNKVPLAHDGMGVFNMEDGKFRLVRNHEDRNAPGAGSAAIDAAKSYDLKGGGGTTTLVVNPFTRQLERHWLSLSGTTVNCAGGITPWNSWITCEETNVGTPTGWLKQHGYCFDVPVGRRQSRARPSRFRRWAASRTRPSRSIQRRTSFMRPKTTAAVAARAGSTGSSRT